MPGKTIHSLESRLRAEAGRGEEIPSTQTVSLRPNGAFRNRNIGRNGNKVGGGQRLRPGRLQRALSAPSPGGVEGSREQ